ncbi:hypothetical protein YPHTV1_00049 [Halomonas phage YPHTV-1]|nr:hypothetical protein YPHTV1_00049 [Halomonas phage YPHTV-1]
MILVAETGDKIRVHNGTESIVTEVKINDFDEKEIIYRTDEHGWIHCNECEVVQEDE